MIDRLMSDVASALRSLRAAPAIPVAVVLTTSLAVAINLAMAGLIDRALLSPPAHVVDPQQVFTVGFEVRSPSGEKSVAATASYLTFEAVQDRVPSVIAAAWTYATSPNIEVGDSRISVRAVGVTGGYFNLLGAHAAFGRTLLPDDDRPPVGAPVAVLSHALWRGAFGADPDALGRQFRFGGLSLQLVGVMPAGFSGHTAQRVDLWLPLSSAMHGSPGWHRQARMATVELGIRIGADKHASGVSTDLAAATGNPVILWPLVGADVAPEPYRIAMWLTGISLVVLAAGLANGATLFLVRSARRRRETSIRAAMGATRGRLVRQLFIESAIVAIGAMGVAILLGFWFDELVRRVLFPTLVERAGVNTVVIVAGVIGGVCTLVVGTIAGVLQLPVEITSEDLAGRRRLWRRSAVQHELLIFQTTLAVLLITGAGMFAQSYLIMAGQNHDSRLTDVLIVSFDDGPASRPDQDQLLTNALDRVRKMPGVDAATLFSALPFRGIHRPAISFPGVGEPRLDGQLSSMIESTPELFDILQIEIVQGRGLTRHDDRGAPVVVVSETMARAVWPGTRAIGKCIRIGFDANVAAGNSAGPVRPPASAPCREVVGIARDWRRERRPDASRYMHYYVPIAQRLVAPPWMMPLPLAEGLLIRKRAGIDLPAEAIRAAVTDGRTDLPFVDVQPYAANEGSRLQHWVIGTQLLLMFGALALATAAMGMYAAFAHSVAERRQEIAVRLAVGASRLQVLVMMLREGAAVAVRGAINGVLVATVVGWSVQSMSFGLSRPGVLVSAAAMAIVLTVAIVATWFPALTASRAEPNTLLRTD